MAKRRTWRLLSKPTTSPGTTLYVVVDDNEEVGASFFSIDATMLCSGVRFAESGQPESFLGIGLDAVLAEIRDRFRADRFDFIVKQN